MTKLVSTLIGDDLARWVARANGDHIDVGDGVFDADDENYVGHIGGNIQPFVPHEEWSQGGPLIVKYAIAIGKGMNQITYPGWNARVGLQTTYDSGQDVYFGPTPLVAAMRALVASVYGKEVPTED